MRLSSTSTQRTYRYLRLAIVGAVVVLAIAVAQVLVVTGRLTSISAAFYTPARSVFVGALFAVALALVALSGRSVEQALLDLAALFAPLIAIVPTPVGPGDVAGLVVECAGAAACVPAAEVAGIQNGMLALVSIGAVGVVAALVLALVQRTLSVPLCTTIAIAAAVVVGVGLWWMLAPTSFLLYGHLVATVAFFGLVAAVAAVAAIATPAPWRGWYAAIAAGIAVVLAALVTVLVLRLNGSAVGGATGIPVVFVGEGIALVLFTVFWIVQTAQHWNETDPTLVG